MYAGNTLEAAIKSFWTDLQDVLDPSLLSPRMQNLAQTGSAESVL